MIIIKAPFYKKLLHQSLILSLLFLSSCGLENGGGKNIEIPGIDGPYVNILEDNILISMIFKDATLDVGGRFAIPKYPNSYIELSPDVESGGTLFAVNLNINDVLDDRLKFLDPKKLPGGRPLPGVVEGALPAIAFSINAWDDNDIAFYVGKKVFGSFIPFSGLDLKGSIATFRFYVKNKRAGNISLVGQDENEENGGFLLMLDFSEQIKNHLRKIAKKYED